MEHGSHVGYSYNLPRSITVGFFAISMGQSTNMMWIEKLIQWGTLWLCQT